MLLDVIEHEQFDPNKPYINETQFGFATEINQGFLDLHPQQDKNNIQDNVHINSCTQQW